MLAPYIYTWPLFALLTAGIILSVVGLRSSAGAEPRVTRRVGFLVNGAALKVDVVVALGIATVLIRSTREQIIIPDGYQGDVYIIHGAADGEASRTRGGITYRIPRDGILRVKEPLSRNWTITEYYYRRKDGTLQPITNFWPSTIHPTPKNLANDRDFGVYFPRSGTFTPSGGCAVAFEQFYVGTKAYLLSHYRENSIFRYLRDHPVRCVK